MASRAVSSVARRRLETTVDQKLSAASSVRASRKCIPSLPSRLRFNTIPSERSPQDAGQLRDPSSRDDEIIRLQQEITELHEAVDHEKNITDKCAEREHELRTEICYIGEKLHDAQIAVDRSTQVVMNAQSEMDKKEQAHAEQMRSMQQQFADRETQFQFREMSHELVVSYEKLAVLESVNEQIATVEEGFATLNAYVDALRIQNDRLKKENFMLQNENTGLTAVKKSVVSLLTQKNLKTAEVRMMSMQLDLKNKEAKIWSSTILTVHGPGAIWRAIGLAAAFLVVVAVVIILVSIVFESCLLGFEGF